MQESDNIFVPEQVDEQIAQFSSTQAFSAQKNTPERRLLQELRGAYGAEQETEQAIEHVWQRLASSHGNLMTHHSSTKNTFIGSDRDFSHRERISSMEQRQKRSFWQVVGTLAGILLVAVLVISMIIVTQAVRQTHQTTIGHQNTTPGKTIGTPVLTPAHAQTAMNGLETTLSITPGPYFLSELLSIDITVTNQSQHDLMLGGSPALNTCTGAFSTAVTGGHEPYYEPIDNSRMSCPPTMGKLDMQKSLSVHGYMPLSKSGTVTVTMNARVYTMAQNQDGTTNAQGGTPLEGHWPTIAINVNTQLPSNRLLSLHVQGTDVLVNAPDSIRAQLVYFWTVTCLHEYGTNGGWEQLKTTKLQEPDCDDSVRHWVYAVGAPGYAVAAISMDS